MSNCILDASALLALFNREVGAEIVQELLPQSSMSTVNVAEVITELEKNLNITPEESKKAVYNAVNQIIPLSFDHAVEIGHLQKYTRQFGLSLGDRACIALGMKLKAPIYTADRIWAKLKLDGANIRLIR